MATLPPPTRPSLAQRSLAVCQAAPAVALCSAAAAAPVALVPPPGAALPCSPRTEQAPRRARPGSDARAQPSVLSQILRTHHMRRGGPYEVTAEDGAGPAAAPGSRPGPEMDVRPGRLLRCCGRYHSCMPHGRMAATL